MIAEHVVDEVKLLLADGGISQRKIAKITRVSRGTVGAIAAGRRRIRKRFKNEDDLLLPSGPFVRCLECGGMVHMPCHKCRTEKAMHIDPAMHAQSLARLLSKIEPLGLDLKPSQKERYLEVRRARRKKAQSLPGPGK
ncbi:MAG TPA: hypothetical protein VIH42_05705 [Thermoguttaceae bacterium]